MKSKVLITGVTGFVGKNLLDYLKNNPKLLLYGVGRNSSKNDSVSHQLEAVYTYDELFAGNESFDIYIHLAGQVIQNQSIANSEQLFREANLELTQKIFNYFSEDKSAKKFLFFSSIHVLTDRPSRVIYEDFTPKPFTPYGKFKYEAENYIASNINSNKSYYILRPTMIHGPGNKGNLKSLFDYLIAGYPYLFDSFNNYRSFLSIENLCFIINEFINNPIPSGLYHLSDDEPTSTRELIDLFEEMLQRKIRRVKIPYSLLYLISKIGEFLPIPFDNQRLAKLTSNFIVSNKKVISAIGKLLPLSSREGMRQTIHSLIEKEKKKLNTKDLENLE